ncbi:MAG: hypothetical protein ACYSYV_02110 [Planctomycetota bacterium]|jgi:hypothetical protein
MKIDHFIYPWEAEAVRLRHFEDLTRQQIGDRLGLRFGQVKYIFSKVNVKHYVQTEILPYFWEKEIAEIQEQLADPIRAYSAALVKCCDAETYEWLAPGKKCYYSDNKTRLWAVVRIGRIYGIFYNRHREPNTERDVLQYAAELRERLALLKENLQAIES